MAERSAPPPAGPDRPCGGDRDRPHGGGQSGPAPPTERVRLERRRLAEQAWERFVHDAEEPTGMPGVIRESWRRSRDAFGIDPGLSAPRAVLDGDALASRLETSLVLEVAGPVLREYAEGLKAHCLAFFDGEGTLLSLGGDGRVVEAVGEIHFRPGVSWAEASAGTNGPGTALATGRPVEVFASEHYVEAWHRWGCAAAPVILPGETAPVALVDLTGRWEAQSHQALHVAKAIATIIRERLQALHAVRAEVVRHAFRAARASGDAILAVDGRGHLIAANDAAARARLGSPGPLPAPLREALAQQLFSPAVASAAEVFLQLPGGPTWSASPVRFQGTAVGALLRLVTGGPGRPLRARPGAAPPGRRPTSSRYDFSRLVGSSLALRAALELARTAARLDLPVVLSGESGTGKELFAHAIHAGGARQEGPFVVVNCGSIPGALVESELFGYEDGAFTGARPGGRPGRFEDADGGTLFLDEVSELPPHAQAALLRLLQEGEVVRVGGSAPRPVDVRILAAAHRPLAEEVRCRRLRRDLYYRLNVLPIAIPPLRARGEDVVEVARLFLTEAGPLVGRTGLSFSEAALRALRAHPWPGNVRELRNVILRAAATAPRSEIGPGDLGLGAGEAECAPAEARPGADTLRQARLESERGRLLEALGRSDWNFALAARRLGVSRTTLYRLARRHAITRAQRPC